MFSSSNVPVFIHSDYRLDPYAIICSVRHKFSMAFSVITVSTWNKWQHCLRMEHRSSLLKQVASALSKRVQCFQWSSQCQCQDLIFSFQASKCYQDLLYLSTLAKGSPRPLTTLFLPLSSSITHQAATSSTVSLVHTFPFSNMGNWRRTEELNLPWHTPLFTAFYHLFFSWCLLSNQEAHPVAPTLCSPYRRAT